MKICFLHHTYPGIGGTETVTNLLACKFRERGWDVSVLAWNKPAETMNADLPVVYLPDRANINTHINSEFIYSYLSDHNVDCLINQGPFWVPTKNARRIKSVIISSLHYAPSYKIDNQREAITLAFKQKSTTVMHFLKSTIRFVFKDYFAKRDFHTIYKSGLDNTVRNSDVFTVLCPDYVTDLQKIMGGAYDNVIAIENGLKLEEHQDIEREKTLVYIGRLSKWDKRIDRLLKIWKTVQHDHPDWSLEILGDGPEKENLENLAKKLKLSNYHFRGFVNIKDYLPKASVLAMTSSSEGFPMVILEAANYGVVPIAYNISSGIAHLIQDNVTGFLIQPFDNRDYVKKLSMIMSDNALRLRIGDNAKDMVRSYDLDRIADRWVELISDRIKSKN